VATHLRVLSNLINKTMRLTLNTKDVIKSKQDTNIGAKRRKQLTARLKFTWLRSMGTLFQLRKWNLSAWFI